MMRNWVSAVLAGGAMLVPLAGAGDTKASYPPAARGSVVDTYFGTTVADPYRWLENVDSPETQTWVNAEKALSRGYLDAIPQRAKIVERLTELYTFERTSVPDHEGSHYFSYHNSGLQDQDVLYVSDSATATGHVLLDPNAFSKDGTVAIGSTGYSPDGRYLAYSTRDAGSDWETWHIRTIATGQDMLDVLKWSKFGSAAWMHDSSGFFYERYDEPKKDVLKAAFMGQKVFFHRIGTPQSADTLAYARPDHNDWFLGANVTDDGRYLVLGTYDETSNNRIYVRDLSEKDGPVRGVFTKNDAAWTYVGNDGSRFFFQTNLEAPRGRIVTLDIAHPDLAATLIPQTDDAIDSVNYLSHRFIISYLHDVHALVRVYDEHGAMVRDVAMPGVGSAQGFSGHDFDRKTYYTFSSYTTPPTGYEYDMISGESRVVRTSGIKFDPSQFTTEEVFYNSRDGTRVPLFISYKKGLVRNGSAPTILYGYGGFDISVTPAFSVRNVAWMEMGGVYAVANLRGGSEYGEKWHEAGMLANKQNVFDDFVAAAHYLIDNRYTSTPKLAINGASNGGLLVGAAETQHPELFGAAIPEVGVMDMLRFQKFTVGYTWASDYGNAEKSAAQFKTLLAYSPYQNIKSGTVYPPTLIMTADHDDRVFPAHSFKFAAAMQYAQAGAAPILLRVEHNAGHGGGTPISKSINEAADRFAFLTKALDIGGTP
ncbi:MAG TPA: prolyl oligopeptidase family serine peptidase [Candidatus Eremiobacteraceae bacterium]|nr:prolyl oligopeptidase family serine peptidase [Candidatus Eremiobacteraceae bacterium]